MGAVDGMVASATLRDGELRLHDLYSGALNAIVRPHSGDARLTAAHLAGSGPPFGPVCANAHVNGILAETPVASVSSWPWLCPHTALLWCRQGPDRAAAWW